MNRHNLVTNPRWPLYKRLRRFVRRELHASLVVVDDNSIDQYLSEVIGPGVDPKTSDMGANDFARYQPIERC